MPRSFLPRLLLGALFALFVSACPVKFTATDAGDFPCNTGDDCAEGWLCDTSQPIASANAAGTCARELGGDDGGSGDGGASDGGGTDGGADGGDTDGGTEDGGGEDGGVLPPRPRQDLLPAEGSMSGGDYQLKGRLLPGPTDRMQGGNFELRGRLQAGEQQ